VRKLSLQLNVNEVPKDWLTRRRTSLRTIIPVNKTEPFVQHHDEPDILVAYSTFYGCYSFRKPYEGSWFIKTLHDVVNSHAADELDLISLLTEVNCKVAFDLESHVSDPKKKMFDEKKQIPSFNSTLTKRVFFNNTVFSSDL